MKSTRRRGAFFKARAKPLEVRHSFKHLRPFGRLLRASLFLILLFLFLDPVGHRGLVSVASEASRESHGTRPYSPVAKASQARAVVPDSNEDSSSPDLAVREKLLLSLVIFIVAFLSGGAPALLRLRLRLQQQQQLSRQSVERGSADGCHGNCCSVLSESVQQEQLPPHHGIRCSPGQRCGKTRRGDCSRCSTCYSSPTRVEVEGEDGTVAIVRVQPESDEAREETRAATILARLSRLSQAVTAGVVTAVGVLHLLPDADEQLQRVLALQRQSGESPLGVADAWAECALSKGAFVSCLGGLFLSAALEVVFCDGHHHAHSQQHSHHHHQHHQQHQHPQLAQEAKPSTQVPLGRVLSEESHLPFEAKATPLRRVAPTEMLAPPMEKCSSAFRGNFNSRAYTGTGGVSLECRNPNSVPAAPAHLAGGGSPQQEEQFHCRDVGCPYTLLDEAEQQPPQPEVVITGTGSNCSSSRGLVGGLLVAGLSGHSVVEGISMAAAPKPQFVAVAILAHKAVESFAVGNALIHGGSKGLRFVLHLSLYAATTPLGVFFGLLLQRLAEPAASSTLNSTSTLSLLPRLLPGIMTGLGAGAFMHLGIVDLLGGELAAASAERSHHQTRKRRAEVIGAAALGALVMDVARVLDLQQEIASMLEEAEDDPKSFGSKGAASLRGAFSRMAMDLQHLEKSLLRASETPGLFGVDQPLLQQRLQQLQQLTSARDVQQQQMRRLYAAGGSAATVAEAGSGGMTLLQQQQLLQQRNSLGGGKYTPPFSDLIDASTDGTMDDWSSEAAVMQQQDEQLGFLEGSVKNLKDISYAIKDEVDIHRRLLDATEQEVEGASIQIKQQRRLLNKLLKRHSNVFLVLAAAALLCLLIFVLVLTA